MLKDLLSIKKSTYFLNMFVFNICRLLSIRQNTIWVFGARSGENYDDNSRYLFEYIYRNNKIIHAVWLTKYKSVAMRIRNKGYEAYTFYSWKGIKFGLRAGVSFYTNGLNDFGIFPLVGGSKVVALWHGMGFKKIYDGKYHGAFYVIKKMLDKVFSWTYRDISISTSAYASEWLSEMFTLEDTNIFITGQPRNDVFRDLTKDNSISEISNCKHHKRQILYMPTYRHEAMGSDAIEKIVTKLYNSNLLGNYLNDTDSVFVVKLHPRSPHVNLPNKDNFVILDYSAVESNQVLLGFADVLVTDYSSCFIDFALLNRPIIFYVPDESDFITKSEALNSGYFDIEKLCKATTVEELIKELSKESRAVSSLTNDMFEDESIKGTCYSENVYNVVAREIKLIGFA